MIMEKLIPRRIVAISTLTAVGALGLSGCTEAPKDYEGTGQEFVVRGPLSSVHRDGVIKIQQDHLEVVSSEGKAEGWFPEHKGQNFLSDKFNFHQSHDREPAGFWGGCADEFVVGEAFDTSGSEINIQDIKPGTEIRVTGKIRETTYYDAALKQCDEKDIAVYDKVEIVDFQPNS